MVRKVLLLASLICMYSWGAWAQSEMKFPSRDDTTKPYLQYPNMPAFNLLGMDSSTIFNTYNIPKGSITALVLFDPDCKHCQDMTARLTAGIDSVKNVQFYFFTLNRNLQRLRIFNEEYHLADYKNIHLMGRDTEFFFLNYFKTRSFPAIALYDKHKKFIALKEGTFSATDVYNMIHQ